MNDLKEYLSKSDFVFHLAGVNRPKDEDEFDKGNRGLTEALVGLMVNKPIPLLMTSSIQAALDNPYGASKKAAEASVLKLARRGAPVYIYRLPNVFGKWCRPNYNSVVATFCHNIAHDSEISISDLKAEVSLVYIDDVVSSFIQAMDGSLKASGDNFYEIPRQFKISLGELASKIRAFRDSRKNLLIPNLEKDFDRFLYATYNSYLKVDDFSYVLDMKRDDRGWLAEFIKSEQSGQIFVSRTKPGVSRGNHWHHTKIEKFLVLDGKADIKFRKVDSKEIIIYSVSGDELKVVDIPAGYTHSITNIGTDDLITLFWADELFNPDKPDTYYTEV